MAFQKMRKDNDEGHISVRILEDNVEPDEAFIDSIEIMVKEAFPSTVARKCSIFRVHEKFHQMNDRAYSPEVASIGPLHHGEPNLLAMETCKLVYMHALLSRTAKTKSEDPYCVEVKKEDFSSRNIKEVMHFNFEKDLKLKNVEEDEDDEEEEEALKYEEEHGEKGWLDVLKTCVALIKRIEVKARKCYFEPITNLESDEFVLMMLIDGLFLIELFLRNAGQVRKEMYDPVFSKIGVVLSLTRDLLLLENQMPMLVLTSLFKVLVTPERVEQDPFFLNRLILNFFSDLMPRDIEILEKYSKYRGKHLLDFVAHTFHPSPRDLSYEIKHLLLSVAQRHRFGLLTHKVRIDSCKVIPSITEMRRSGIKFKKGSTTGSFLDIKFNSKKGVLEIPPVIIQDKTEILFRNLIAYEQCSDGEDTYISSYAFFMDCLIDSADDVRILCSEDIIENCLGSGKDVSNLFNKLCCEVIVDHSHYSGLCEEINYYCRKNRHIWRATLKRDYFHNPWATISFFAAILLLGLTITSTIFSILSYVIHHS